MNELASKVWSRVLIVLKLKISESDYNSWLLNVRPVSLDERFLTVEVDNNFIKERIESKFKTRIVEILNEILILEGYKDLNIVVKEEREQNFETKQLAIETFNVEEELKSSTRTYNLSTANNLNPKYVFRKFIVGKSNEFADAASEAVAKAPGKVYNPLFIYGGVGLGKTHLMHAIGNHVLKNDKNKKIYYCSSEQFTNDMIHSLKNDKMSEFREKYRKLDVLLIDDIQFIAGKDSTQEEFFHTFNELHQSGKQIVMSSDRPPKEIDKIEKRLVSRFEWGLIADVQPPDYETRVAILTNKAEQEGIDVSEEVLRYIAEAINSNIRELEGALNRIAAKASLLKKEITVDLVEEIFYDVLKNKTKIVSKEKIINTVSEFYNISIEEMKSTKRKREITKARQIAMFLLREILQMSFVAIGELFGGKDHTTVMHSVSKVEDDIKANKYFGKDISTIREKIVS